MSSSYERMNYITSFGFSIRWRKQFIFQFNRSQEPIKVLDLFCGMGETWGFIKERFPNSEITALDFSEGMLESANSRNNKNFNSSVKILNEDIFANTLKNNSFDFVVCGFGLKTFNEQQLDFIAKEINRILKPNGIFGFVEVSEPDNKLLRSLYSFYLKNLIPILGKMFLGNPMEYKMLWKYTEDFKNAKNSAEIFKSNNLQTSYQEYFFGCATGIFGRKL